MKYSIEEKDGVSVISIRAGLEGGPDTHQLKDEIKGHLSAGKRKFILDMTHAGFVNSTGIGVVVGVLHSVKQDEGDLKLSGVSEISQRSTIRSIRLRKLTFSVS